MRLLSLLLAFLFAVTLVVGQPCVLTPVEEEGNPSCPEGTIELKVEPVVSGSYNDGTLFVNLTVDGVFFDFTSNLGVDAVIAKGGPNGNVYTSSCGEFTSGTDLHAPINPMTESPYGLSHISFCYDLELEGAILEIETELTREFGWNISKSADQTEFEVLMVGDTVTVNYVVQVTKFVVGDSGFTATGSFKLSNPLPCTVDGSFTGSIPGATSLTFSEPSTFSLASGDDLTVSFEAELPDDSDRTITITVNYEDCSGTDKVLVLTGDISFANATIHTVNDEAVVDDTWPAGPQDDPITESTTYEYSMTFELTSLCTTLHFDNVATVTFNETTLSDTVNVTLTNDVCECICPCPESGCTRTIGYWKTHAGFGPQDDVLSQFLPIWLGTAGGATSVQVTTAAQAVTILSIPTASNGIDKLKAQLLAAKLNIAAGADGADIASVIAAADAFLATHSSASWSTLTAAEKQMVNGWMNALDQYNNGDIGPGHCDSSDKTPGDDANKLEPKTGSSGSTLSSWMSLF